MPCDPTYMWNLKTKQESQAHRYREQTRGCQRRVWGVIERGEGGSKVQTSSYKINKSWDVMYSLVTVVNNTALRASLVVQWLRICLPMQGTRVRALVWEYPTCCGATNPVRHNY